MARRDYGYTRRGGKHFAGAESARDDVRCGVPRNKWIPIALAVTALALAGIGVALWVSIEDPAYLVQERLSGGRWRSFDPLIAGAGKRYGVDPALIKAIIWRETRFQPTKVGSAGERGLMQVTEGAAADWAKAEHIETFVPQDLMDPKVNIEAGTWYLAKALKHWSGKDHPLSFALAEYNAGRSRVQRWVRESGQGENAGAGNLRDSMDFPGTKSYVASILDRYDFYKKRGDFAP